MSITIGKKQFRLTGIVLGAGLLVLYFGQYSVQVSANSAVLLAVPYAFLWLMWTLNGIKNGKVAELEKKISDLEAR